MQMSFSSDLKNEMIINSQQEEDCCSPAELSAMLAFGGSIYLRREGVGLRFLSESARVTRRAFTLVKEVSGVSGEISAAKRSKLNKGNLYMLEISDSAAAEELLEKTMIAGRERDFTRRVPQEILTSDCCKRAYLRGAFLAAGTASDPRKGYHLEVTCQDESYAKSFCEFLRGFTLNAKVSPRRDGYVVYIKDSEGIVDFMSLAGASSLVFAMENTRIMKEMRNNINRAMNCDIANESKTLMAAKAQAEDIQYLIDKDIFRTLSRQLRETAEIRLENPDVSLQDLGEMHSPPRSKSCINHRLGKLRSIARQHRQEEEGIYDHS
jgi:DNA-binding protein WhiA